MARLPLHDSQQPAGGARGSGEACGAGLEKIYPTSGVRYGAMNWIGEFRHGPKAVFKCGAHVVIQTDRGIELGEQVSLVCHGCAHAVSREQIKAYIKNSGPEFYRLRAGRILREATKQDINEHRRLNAHVREDVDRCALLAARLDLDMKVITAEHLLGGERIVFYFRADGRVDFRELVRQLARHYQTRIEMRQVGARDEARLVADYEVCGRECCCKNFLKKLRPVTMRMAKIQKSTLDPTKVSGRCGRLRCCLRYEHEGYDELARKLPRHGTRVETEFGVGTVVDRQILTQLLMVRFDDGRVVAIPVEETRKPGEPPPPPKTPPVETPEPVPTGESTAQPPEGGKSRRDSGRPRSRRRPRRRRKGGGSAETGTREAGSTPPTARGSADKQREAATPRAPAGGKNAQGNKKGDKVPARRRRRRRRRPRGDGSAGSGGAGT